MKLVLLPDAKRDVLESVDSFNALSKGLGDRFEGELFECFSRIRSDPELYAANSNGFRACKLSKFQAVVYFRLESNSLVVFRVCVNGRTAEEIDPAG